jgi:hypothetical protein
MNCPNCGAPMEPVGNRNHLRCPYCQTVHVPDGESDGVVPLGREARLSCPVCAVRLNDFLSPLPVRERGGRHGTSEAGTARIGRKFGIIRRNPLARRG